MASEKENNVILNIILR